MSAAGDPVFVHSSYRVSSTWFFARLRAVAGVRAYYEVFHERLASLSLETLSEFGPKSWSSGHPHTEPYFREFEGLLEAQGGVRGFTPELPYGRFLPKDGPFGDISEAERNYVRLLIENARANGKTPVLTCKRSLLRAAGLKRAFGGRHILLVRDLYPQWVSYVRNTSGPSYYFLTVTLLYLLKGREDPFLGQLFKSHVIKHEVDGAFEMARFPEQSAFLQAFIATHVYAYMAAHRSADVILNVSDLGFGRRDAGEARAEVFNATGLDIDLMDCRETETAALDSVGALDENFCGWALEEAAAALGLESTDPAYQFAAHMVAQLIRDFRGE